MLGFVTFLRALVADAAAVAVENVALRRQIEVRVRRTTRVRSPPGSASWRWCPRASTATGVAELMKRARDKQRCRPAGRPREAAPSAAPAGRDPGAPPRSSRPARRPRRTRGWRPRRPTAGRPSRPWRAWQSGRAHVLDHEAVAGCGRGENGLPAGEPNRARGRRAVKEAPLGPLTTKRTRVGGYLSSLRSPRPTSPTWRVGPARTLAHPSSLYGRPVPEPTASTAPLVAGPDGTRVKTASPRAWSWAALMHRAFGIDVLACAHCGGPTADRHAARSRGHPEDPRGRSSRTSPSATRGRVQAAPLPSPAPPRPNRIGSGARRTPSLAPRGGIRADSAGPPVD